MRVRHGVFAALLLAAVVGAGGGIARSGEPTAGEIADLVAELRDPDAHVREVAHKSLVGLGAAPTDALVAAVCGSDRKLAVEALSVLADIGPAAKAAAPKLVELAAKSDADGFLALTRALARVDPPAAAPLLKRFFEFWDGVDAARQAQWLTTLAALGPSAKDAGPALLARLAASPAPALRRPLLETLAAVGVDPAAGILDLWSAHGDPVGAWAPQELIAIGDKAAATAAQRLRSDDKGARVTAATALGAMGVHARDAVPDLAFALKDETGAVRRAAARSLGLVGADAQVALAALTEGVSDAKLRIQREAAASIGEIGVAMAPQTAAPPAIGALESAVAAGVDWLARHQAADGHWSAEKFHTTCKGALCEGPGDAVHDVGVTGLALLGLLGAGESTVAGAHRDAVARGLAYLRGVQDTDGCFGPRRSSHFMYDHACAALAMTEACAKPGGRGFRDAAQRGVDFGMKAKNPYLAWRYNVPADGDNDTSVSGWMSMVVKSADACGLVVEKSALNDAATWVEKMTEPEFGRTGYQQRGGPPARTREMMKDFPPERVESLTAVGLVIRFLAGRTAKEDHAIEMGVELIARKPPKWDVENGSIDFYYWLYATKAMRFAGGTSWLSWKRAILETLLRHQDKSAACSRGSFLPLDPWSPEGGRIYATSAALLCLEMCTTVSLADQRPAMSETLRAAFAALLAARKSDDADVRNAVDTTLDLLRAVYRTEGVAAPPTAATPPAPTPEAPPAAQPAAPGPSVETSPSGKPVGSALAYMSWLRRYVDARTRGAAAAAESAWDDGTKKTWAFPAEVVRKTDAQVFVRLSMDGYIDVPNDGLRYGLGPEERAAEVADPAVRDALAVGARVTVAIDLEAGGAAKFAARVAVWKVAAKK